MRSIRFGNVFDASEMALGCMRLCRVPEQEAEKLIHTAIEQGINYFDHADVYGFGASEEAFGKIIKKIPGVRSQIFIQTKCTLIRDSEKTLYLDTTKKHILKSVDESLKRLGTDYIDTYMLHHPDTLMEPEEIAEAFDVLQRSGKVRYFGVSNFKRMELMYLQSCLSQKLIVNQMQLGIAHTEVIDSSNSIKLNDKDNIDHNGSVLTYMRMHKMTLQAWSPFQVRFYGGVFMNDSGYPMLNKVVDRLGRDKGASPSAVAIAWILRHPAKIQPMIGTTKAVRLNDICTASDITLTRAEWYELYRAALSDEGRIQLGNSNNPPK